jgi:hypothetical protein
MAIGFNQTKGSAQKEKIETYNYAGKEDHHVRLVGDLLPRYVYWIKGENGKNIPMECLSFDRENETFNNKEHDHVRDFYPDLKCGWSYAVQCIDYADKSVKVLNLKSFVSIHLLRKLGCGNHLSKFFICLTLNTSKCQTFKPFCASRAITIGYF